MRSNCGIRNSERSQSGKRKAESGKQTANDRLLAAHSARSSFRFPPSTFRIGTTLIELLITITIIAILSAAFLGVSNLAMENGREARTKSTIGKIHGLLMEKWNSYATRRVDLNAIILNDLDNQLRLGNINRRQRGEMLADARLLATRELMKYEMPDRWSDLIGDEVKNVLPSASPNAFAAPARVPRLLSDRPALAKTFLRRYTSLNTSDVAVIQRNQGAECLYLIVMLSTADGEARTLFSEQDIGDIDGDGALEFHDGWGRPISYIRWPAGFAVAGQSSLIPADADTDHDSFDLFRRDQPQPVATQIPTNLYPSRMQPLMVAMRNRHGLTDPISAFRLVPLIYSSGPDGDSDLVTFTDAIISDPYLDYSQNNPAAQTRQPSLGGLAVSDNDGDNWLDNIHNHLQDNK